MLFVNTLPYISNPIEEFRDYKFVDWESGIYPKFKSGIKPEEIKFFTNFIQEHKLTRIIDLGVGGGIELAAIVEGLKVEGYSFESAEANEVDDRFITQAQKHFVEQKCNVVIHKANWLDLPKSNPVYTHDFDFGFLTGNSLTYIGGGTREYTKKAQQIVVSKFADMIEPGAYLFIDSRNYDYIRSLMNLSQENIFQNFTFDYTVYYHGFQEKILVFPAYISDTVVVLHYYDKEAKIWGKLDLYPIYQNDMLEILSQDFEIEQIWYDFNKGTKEKSLFMQYLVKRKAK